MKLVSVTMEGFRSFSERTTIPFDEGGGLYLVTGENGAGKSTIGSAICWCFYNKTDRGVSGPHVESWYSDKPCEVTVEFTLGGSRHVVTRKRKPNAFSIDGNAATNRQLVDLVGMSYDRFLQIVLLGQFGTLFADMGSAHRLSLVTEVLDLDYWVRAADVAKEWHTLHDRQLLATESALVRVDQAIEAAEKNLASIDQQQETWKEQRADELWRLRKEFARLKEVEESAIERAQELEANLERAEATREEKDAKVDQLTKRIEDQEEVTQDHERREAVLIHSLETLRDDLDRMEDLTADAKCPECWQEVPQEHVDKIVSKLKVDYEEKRLSLAATKQKVAASKANEDQLMKLLKVAREEKQSADARYDDMAREQYAARLEARQSNHTLDAMVRSIKDVRARTSPFGQIRKEAQEQLEKLDREADDLEGLIATDRAVVDLLENWPRLFKELRLWIVEEALAELEAYSNSALSDLGLRDWRLMFEVERETKSGSLVRGFQIVVLSPESPDGVPWEVWSGGETQRIRIACAVGLSMLMRSRMAHPPEFEVWDEPTAHLNQQGVDDLVRFMADRGRDHQVWLIDHRTIDQGAVTRSIHVEKTEEGSRVRA